MYRLILIIFLISSGLTAQQLPLYSQYMFDNYLINPAVSGTYDYTMINGSIRHQWGGFDNNSVNAIYSSHMADAGSDQQEMEKN